MIEQLQKEIDLIMDLRLKTLIIKTLEKAPEYFWSIPASSTGRHHPKEDNEVSGLIKHTRKAVKIGCELCEAFGVEGFKRDVVIASLILHDSVKNGYPTNSGFTVAGHGYQISQLMRDAKIMDNKNSDLREVINAAATHMGRWDFPFDTPHDAIGLIVHLADYIVSRKCVNIDLEACE